MNATTTSASSAVSSSVSTATHNRIAKSIPAMLEGQRRARERKAAELAAKEAAAQRTLDCAARRLYRREKAIHDKRVAKLIASARVELERQMLTSNPRTYRSRSVRRGGGGRHG
jgi:hypothetical protein